VAKARRGNSILVVDVGGNNIKCALGGSEERRKTPSGPALTAQGMADAVKALCADWTYDVVSVGVPCPVTGDRVTREPVNLGPGWVGFDFGAAFGRPTRLLNDAAMQALGSYEGGRMLFLGLGTGLGNTLIADGVVIAMELAHLPYKRKRTIEDYVGQRGLKRLGKKRWCKAVHDVFHRLQEAMVAEYVVVGGGNAKLLDPLPPGCRLGDNLNAFAGGLRLWEGATAPVPGGPGQPAAAAPAAG
jgi:polyphosphate glucokinase